MVGRPRWTVDGLVDADRADVAEVIEASIVEGSVVPHLPRWVVRLCEIIVSSDSPALGGITVSGSFSGSCQWSQQEVLMKFSTRWCLCQQLRQGDLDYPVDIGVPHRPSCSGSEVPQRDAFRQSVVPGSDQ